MISWTGFGWIGWVYFVVAVAGATVGANQFPEHRLASWAAAWAVVFVSCFASGLFLRRFFPLPLHCTIYGKETVSHECGTVELEWAGLYTLPFFAVLYLLS